MSNQPEEKNGGQGQANQGVGDTLGARGSARVLVIAQRAGASGDALREAAGQEEMSQLRGWLEAADHAVSMATPSQWQQAAAATHPTLVLIEAGEQTEIAAEICRAAKTEAPRRMVLAVLPAGKAALDSWPALYHAGADDFVQADVARPAFEARVSLLARMALWGTELEVARERIGRHTQIDETTQLLNRRFFFQTAHRECSRARRYDHVLACLMVDIDYLDEMGKTFGYGCVEYVLRAVAYTVRQWTRDSDVVGRFSEHKFAILLPETDVEGAMRVREKILGAMAENRFAWEGQELPVSVSIGESERRRTPPGDESTPGIEPEPGAAPGGDEAALEELGSEPLSVREELAALLEDADAALSVARRANIRPEIFVQYTPGGEEAANVKR